MFSTQDLLDAFPDHEVIQPELGSGGYKLAYLARRGNEQVVLKLTRNPVPTAWDRADGVWAEGRIAQELRILREVNSPRVVGLRGSPGIAKIAGRPHLFYEESYLPGGTLAQRIAAGPLSAREVVTVGLEVLEGVADLWNQLGVVHRDIKPSNIAFDTEGKAVLFDLGTAFDPSITDQTDSGDIAPKSSMYAAPEQFYPRAGAKLDYRTDIFSLGLSLLEARIGRHPFVVPGMRTDEYLASIDQVTLAHVESLGVEPELAKALFRCVQRTVSRRFRTLELLRTALEAAA